ncbi:hypothetical protein LINGRAPRIM_LOCUS3383, partial [Linum grandiflorum]
FFIFPSIFVNFFRPNRQLSKPCKHATSAKNTVTLILSNPNYLKSNRIQPNPKPIHHSPPPSSCKSNSLSLSQSTPHCPPSHHFPEQSNLQSCSLHLPLALFPGVKSAVLPPEHHRFTSPAAFSVDGGNLVGDRRMRRLENDCLSSSDGFSSSRIGGCSKCLNTLNSYEIVDLKGGCDCS